MDGPDGPDSFDCSGGGLMAPTYRELTYRELRAALNVMHEDDLDKSATVWCEATDEFLPLKLPAIQSLDTDGVLDPFHPVLVIDY